MAVEWIARDGVAAVGQQPPADPLRIGELQGQLNAQLVRFGVPPIPITAQLDDATCQALALMLDRPEVPDWSAVDGTLFASAVLGCGYKWPPRPGAPFPNAPHTYVVQSGDTLVGIAGKYLGTQEGNLRWKELRDANPHKPVRGGSDPLAGAFVSMLPGERLWLPAQWPDVPGGGAPFPFPKGCPAGQVRDASGNCVQAPPGPAPPSCPAGQVFDPTSGQCIPAPTTQRPKKKKSSAAIAVIAAAAIGAAALALA